jgi:hypothetical protein
MTGTHQAHPRAVLLLLLRWLLLLLLLLLRIVPPLRAQFLLAPPLCPPIRKPDLS